MKIGLLFRDLRNANLTPAGVVRQWRHFNAAFYRARYPEVAVAGMHPFLHYLLHGGGEGRKPCAWFDPEYYLAGSAEARRRGGNPFLDYLENGPRERTSPHPLMDCKTLGETPKQGSLFGCGGE